MIFKLKASIDETEFEIKALFGMEANVSTADLRGETLTEMFMNVSSFMGEEKPNGVEALKFAKQVTYQGYLSYCSAFGQDALYNEKTVSIIFDCAGDLQETIFEWGKVYFSTMPKVNDTPTPDTKKK